MKKMQKDILKSYKTGAVIFAILIAVSLILLAFGIKFAESFVSELLIITFFSAGIILFKAVDMNLHLKYKKVFLSVTVICILGIIILFLGLATVDYIFINSVLSRETCFIFAGLYSVAVLIKFTFHNNKLKFKNQLIYDWRNISK
ncbi:MAG: hypothetical protein IJO19_03015 [Clostridia bacterium]|nr:hypothetical protein [Clostridia bacterium]